MSAFGTKKATGDAGVALTFPLNFQKMYELKNGGMTTAYYPSDDGRPFDIMIGTHFQAEYHAQKRAEAVQSVMNGLQARKTAERLLLTGPHNYHLPKPVLGQRQYANPSCGAEAYSSTRRDNGKDAPFRTVEVGREGAGLRGGVVRTAEGQEFYKQQLDRRIAQLNRINAAAQGFTVQMGQKYRTDDNTKTGSFNKVQFFTYLRAMIDAVIEGDLSNFSFQNLKEMLEQLFKFGPVMTLEDIDDARDGLDSLIDTIRDGLSETPDFANEPEKKAYSATLGIMTERMRKYIGEMENNLYRSEKDKRTLSASLRKSLGFESLIRKAKTPMAALREIAEKNPRAKQVDEDVDDDDGGDGRFDRPAQNREDAEARGMPRAPFAGRAEDPNRARHGQRAGVVIHGGPRYFGDDEEEDAAPQQVAPLSIAGADPNAEPMPEANPNAGEETLLAVVKTVLRQFDGFQENDESTYEEFINTQYPDTADFVREVARGMEDRGGYSTAQIADAMRRTGLEMFNEYVAENAGPTGAAPIRAARAPGLNPIGGLQPPLYVDADEDGSMDVAPAESIGAYNFYAQLAAQHNLPRNREEFNANYRTIGQLVALANRLPEEAGGRYGLRATTTVRNAKQALIARLKRANPSF
jgi:hypothetical protein